MYGILGERLPAAIFLIRGWKPLPQVSFLVTWTYRISAFRHVWVGVMITIFIFKSKNLLRQLRIWDSLDFGFVIADLGL